jgi:tetratricopeptide (TPR) repeat protein
MKYFHTICLLALCVLPVRAQLLKSADQEQLLEYYQSQRYDDASKLLQSAFGEDPQDLKATAMLAYASNMAGNLKLAERQYLKLNQADPKNIAVLFSIAGIHAKRGNDEKAKKFYQEVLKVDSNNFRALKLIASTASDPDERLKYLKRASKLNPADGDVAYDLAVELNRLRQQAEAYQILDEAFKSDTSNYMLLKAKLPLCISLKKLNEAQQTGNKLLLNGDSSSYVINSMGRLAMDKKDYKKAIALFKVLEGRTEVSESSLYYTAICYEKLRDMNNAREYIKATIDAAISPNVSSYYNFLAYAHESAGAYKSAQMAYLRALQFSKTNEVYYSLGLLNDLKLKNKTAALRYYKQYLKGKPDEKLASDNISYVKGRIKVLTN